MISDTIQNVLEEIDSEESITQSESTREHDSVFESKEEDDEEDADVVMKVKWGDDKEGAGKIKNKLEDEGFKMNTSEEEGAGNMNDNEEEEDFEMKVNEEEEESNVFSQLNEENLSNLISLESQLTRLIEENIMLKDKLQNMGIVVLYLEKKIKEQSAEKESCYSHC